MSPLPPLPKVIDHEGLPLQGVVTYVSLVEAFVTGQNEIKGSTFVLGADQGIKTNSEQLISTNQHILSDTVEVQSREFILEPMTS